MHKEGGRRWKEDKNTWRFAILFVLIPAVILARFSFTKRQDSGGTCVELV